MPEASESNLDFAKSKKSAKHASRACESCRALKVRCQPAPDGSAAALQGQCQRCADVSRDCVFKEPSRTRAKRTDVKVRELEREVKALSDLLKSEALPKQPQLYRAEPSSILDTVEAGSVTQQKKRKMAAEQPDANLLRPQCRTRAAASVTRCPSSPGDVVDMGLVTVDEATNLFGIYVNQMLPHRPLVVFPTETTPASLRIEKPILFLAVLAAAAGTFDEQLGMALHQQIQHAFAEHLVIRAERSLELIQALLVHTNWYYSPDSFDELNFYRYLHMAATMAVELGLDGKYAARHRHKSTEDEKDTLGGDAYCYESDESLENIESRRTLLASYICCASVSLAFHRPKAHHFTPYMAESIDILESSLYAAPTDKRLAAWAKLLSIMDLSADSLRLNDHADVDTLAETQIQLNLKNCSKQLQDWEKSLSPAIKNECLYINYQFYVCVLHESGLYADYDPKDFKPPYSIGQFRTKRPEKAARRHVFTSSHISSIIACLSSAHSLLDIFLSMSSRSLQFSPVIVIVRAVYATFLLFEIFLSASAPSGNLNQILDPTAIKLPFYLQQLKMKLVEVASLGCRLAAKFSSVATQLQEWLSAESQGHFRDPEKPQDLDFIRPFRCISLETDSRSALPEREGPGLPRNGSFIGHEPSADNSDTLVLKHPQVGHSSTLNSAIPAGDAVSAPDPFLADYHWPADWSGQDATDSFATFGPALADEFFNPDFNPNLRLEHNMDINNNGGGDEDLVAYLPLSVDLPCPPSMNYLDSQADSVDGLQFS